MSTSTSQAAQQPLQAISNIIELKPDRKYLLVFKGNDMDLSMLHALDDVLKAAEIHCISIALSAGEGGRIAVFRRQ